MAGLCPLTCISHTLEHSSLELFPREPCHSLRREPFSHRGFLRGEKVAKPDEGGALRDMGDLPTLIRERSKARE